LPDIDRAVEDYNLALGRVCGAFHVDARVDARDTVSGAVQHRRLSRYDAAIVSLNAHSVVRNRAMIRTDPGEHLFLLFQYQGFSRILQGDHCTDLATGDLYIADSTVPSQFIYEGQRSRQVSLHLPRREAMARLGPECAGGMAIARGDPKVLAMQAVLHSLLTAEDAGSPAMGEALLNILAAYCQAHRKGAPDPAGQLYRRALTRLVARAGDASFGLDELAADLGVSRRSVQRVFGDHADSFTARLLTVRLDMAQARLRSLTGAGRGGIARIAYECGFNDLSHFYRVFRGRFGMPPGQVRFDD